jgi:2-dehydro-3-deoxygalactonokinase
MDYFAVDSGTTNSRVWWMRDREVIAKRQAPAGVRDSAISGDNRVLMQGIRQAMLELTSERGSEPLKTAVAAGMITSNLGLHEVRHVQAPAGVAELAAGVQTRQFEEIESLVFHFIPGVRSGPGSADLENVNAIDIMRGEETEIIGALETLNLQGPLLYIHLGSHTKMVRVDASNRIAAGASTLAGELLHSIRQQTILRSSLPESQLPAFDEAFFQRGRENADRFGFTRALYQVRIFDLTSSFSKESLASFCLGAVLSEDFRCFQAFAENTDIQDVVLSGLPHLQPAWIFALQEAGFSVRHLSAAETESAFLAGLSQVFTRYHRLSSLPPLIHS